MGGGAGAGAGAGAGNVNLEWSLPVPSVQELANQQPENVPPRYIRDDVQNHLITSNNPSFSVPLIDMANLANPLFQEPELLKLHSACKHWGIFQLVNHGVSGESLTTMKKQLQEFFNLPLQEKKRCSQKPGSLEGYGQAFVVSKEQKLEWNDMIFLKTLPTYNRNLDLWPQHPQKFRETLEIYSENMRQVAVSILRFMAMGLGVGAQDFSDAYKEGKFEVRMNCYPPCPEPERVLGVSSHADISGITLLLECGDTPGLQVWKDGHWVFVEPIADAIVVNIGHITEMMSNGIYKAPDHRAMVDRWKERLSIVTFCYPNTNVDIGPAKELGNPSLYKTVTHDEYFHRFFNRKLDVPFIDSLKI